MKLKVEKNIDREVQNLAKLYYRHLKPSTRDYFPEGPENWKDETEILDTENWGKIHGDHPPIVALAEDPEKIDELDEKYRVTEIKYLEDHRAQAPYLQVKNTQGRYTYFFAKFFGKGLKIIAPRLSYGTLGADCYCQQDHPFMIHYYPLDHVPDEAKESGVILISPMELDGDSE